MSQKNYPKIIVLRKRILGFFVIGVALILLIILRNLYSSSAVSHSVESESSTPIVANQSDTNWYKNQETQQPIQKNPNITTVSNSEKEYKEQISEDQVTMKTIPQDISKAMSMPITSNQLTQTVITVTPHNELSIATSPYNIPTSDNQNMQKEKNTFIKNQSLSNDNDLLQSTVKEPPSPWVIQAGSIIPGILLTGINSDLPGQITGQVKSNVYDSISGKYILIPQGSKLTGLYDSQIAYGQERVLIVWKRIIFPDGNSINLQGMPGTDLSGYSGFNDQVNNHYSKIFGSVILMSILSAGAQLSQPQDTDTPWTSPSVAQTMAQSLGTNLMNTATTSTTKNINIQPTLEIRPGYEFTISVTKDMIFNHFYG